MVSDVLGGILVMGGHAVLLRFVYSSPAGRGVLSSSASRTAMAAANTATVTTKLAKKAACTMSLKLERASQSPTKIRKTLTASALNIVRSASPAVLASPCAARHPYTPPAPMLT